MLIQAVQTAAYRFFDAVTASIGNLAVTRDKEHVEKILYRILFLNAWMFSFCSVGLLCLLQPFIRIWIGSEYLLSDTTMLVIVINFYLEGMRATMVTFKRATGLFWQSRYKAIAEGALNLVLSIPLAVHFGVAGTLMGTIISTSCISAIVEPYALFRYYFHKGFLSVYAGTAQVCCHHNRNRGLNHCGVSYGEHGFSIGVCNPDGVLSDGS